jgi:hypothetical protein
MIDLLGFGLAYVLYWGIDAVVDDGAVVAVNCLGDPMPDIAPQDGCLAIRGR